MVSVTGFLTLVNTDLGDLKSPKKISGHFAGL